MLSNYFKALGAQSIQQMDCLHGKNVVAPRVCTQLRFVLDMGKGNLAPRYCTHLQMPQGEVKVFL